LEPSTEAVSGFLSTMNSKGTGLPPAGNYGKRGSVSTKLINVVAAFDP
jgi:hypothetical protein